MVQTKEGASNNPWLKAQQECAEKYKESKTEGAQAKASPKAAKGQTNAQNTRGAQ